MIKKSLSLFLAFAFAVFFATIVLAETNCTIHTQVPTAELPCCVGLNQSNGHCCNVSIGGIWNGSACSLTPATTQTNSLTTNSDTPNLDKAISCLSSKLKTDCSGATTIQEISLSILASTNVTSQCVSKLKTYDKGNCFGSTSQCSIRDTALAILALSHVNEGTTKYTDWLKTQTTVATDLIWYLEQDSNSATTCNANYNSQQYPFETSVNKKLSSSAGDCLSLTSSNYWFLVSPSCYDTNFSVVCNSDFLITLMYQQPNSNTYYVLSDTKFSSANQPVNFKIKSQCFGSNNYCNYEDTAWAAMALDRTGNDIATFIPYLVATSEINSQYLPNAFLNMLVDYSEYGTKLISQQTLNYWEADGTLYNKYYDTALALVSLSNSNQQQVLTARNWLLNSAQDADGCWNSDNVRDTAIAIWALGRGRTFQLPTSPTITSCESSNGFCVPYSSCVPQSERLSMYSCPNGEINVCCKNQLPTCTAQGGKVCEAGKVCDGAEGPSKDSDKCCLSGYCKTEVIQSECEIAGGSCRSSCSSTQENISASCDSSLAICCKTKSTPKKEDSGSLLWLWILIGILIVLLIIAILYREKIKIWIYKQKKSFKEENPQPPRQPITNSRGPPHYPPRGPMPIQQARRPLPQTSREPDDVFKKLKDISK
jgi:hypothetical protein